LLANSYDVFRNLTSPQSSLGTDFSALYSFAQDLGWNCTDTFVVPRLGHLATAHMVVEHGLRDSAVLSFLNRRLTDVGRPFTRSLLTVSYNNLIDWHILVDPEAAHFVYNRVEPWEVAEVSRLSSDNLEGIRRAKYETVIGKRPTPNIPALDDALIRTLSFWKRNLAAEVGTSVSNDAFSALFNTLILIRALEDHRKSLGREADFFEEDAGPPTLLGRWTGAVQHQSLSTFLTTHLQGLADGSIPGFLEAVDQLVAFDPLSTATCTALIADFYRSRFAPYEYDFSIISKHALSRIYEQYVSLLRVPGSMQQSLFPELPEETRDKAYGSIYTPQFIARFFARYLAEQYSPGDFLTLRASDPACGSGIFLRTLVEVQVERARALTGNCDIAHLLDSLLGIDVDANAVYAARLSLSLLHLVLADRLPDQSPIVTAEAMDYFDHHPELRQAFDAVLVNPPFVSRDTQPSALKARLALFLGSAAGGKSDLYLAFLTLSLEMLKPGGYGCFVLPHSFLLSRSARKTREWLLEGYWVRALVDLSAVRVFENVSTYVVLLVCQRRSVPVNEQPSVLLVRAQALPGIALEAAVRGRRLETDAFTIDEVAQSTFRDRGWVVLPPAEQQLADHLAKFPRLQQFLDVRQGYVSGHDEVFIVPRGSVPKGEEALFRPLLRDREMLPYSVPRRTAFRAFYPFLDGKKLDERVLRRDFPKTWAYLTKHRHKLTALRESRGAKGNWWEPWRARPSEVMLRPKLVSPHLVVAPRFGLDSSGQFVVSHSPFLIPQQEGAELDLLTFFVAVLNSTVCYWHISRHSHKYERGYAMLENKTLRDTPVPDPTGVSAQEMRKLLGLVSQRLGATAEESFAIERQIDKQVADLFALSAPQRQILGLVD
jgi:hypothetical protein